MSHAAPPPDPAEAVTKRGPSGAAHAETLTIEVGGAPFAEACRLLNRPELPAKIAEVAEKRPAQLFAVFRKAHAAQLRAEPEKR